MLNAGLLVKESVVFFGVAGVPQAWDGLSGALPGALAGALPQALPWALPWPLSMGIVWGIARGICLCTGETVVRWRRLGVAMGTLKSISCVPARERREIFLPGFGRRDAACWYSPAMLPWNCCR